MFPAPMIVRREGQNPGDEPNDVIGEPRLEKGTVPAVVKDDKLAIGTVMSITLSVDHRVVDGAVGAEFTAAFKKLIEAPEGWLK